MNALNFVPETHSLYLSLVVSYFCDTAVYPDDLFSAFDFFSILAKYRLERTWDGLKAAYVWTERSMLTPLFPNLGLMCYPSRPQCSLSLPKYTMVNTLRAFVHTSKTGVKIHISVSTAPINEILKRFRRGGDVDLWISNTTFQSVSRYDRHLSHRICCKNTPRRHDLPAAFQRSTSDRLSLEALVLHFAGILMDAWGFRRIRNQT